MDYESNYERLTYVLENTYMIFWRACESTHRQYEKQVYFWPLK